MSDVNAKIDAALRGASAHSSAAALSEIATGKVVSAEFELIAVARTGTEGALAELLVRRHRRELRYVAGDTAWACYNGTVWTRDSDLVARKLLQGIVRSAFEAVTTMPANDANAAMVGKFALRAHTRRFQSGALALAEPQCACDVGDFDADPWLLNVANGTLDLRSGQLREHDPADLCSKQTRVMYDPAADCPLWRDCLTRWLQDDGDLIAFVQRLVGYLLVADPSEHKLAILNGPGANGKSTFVLLMQDLLGDYATTIALDSLLEPPRNRDGAHHSEDIASLAGKRAAFANESKRGRKLDDARVQALTGGDRVSARRAYGRQFDFQNRARLVLSTNHLPKLDTVGESMRRRLAIVPFSVVIPPAERDRHLPDKLRGELSGVLNWALAGLADWRERGLGEAPAVSTATEDYIRSQDLVGRFIDTELTSGGKDARLFRSELRTAWTRFLREEGEGPKGDALADASEVYKELRRRGVEEGKVEGDPAFKGITLTDYLARRAGAAERVEP